ncbi:MAG: DUF116 domain-containing protein [Candidatus Diapherotrites archaeon]|nr:DUF116 domain-containing protein [Candidatus Diapherotrites archaeon]
MPSIIQKIRQEIASLIDVTGHQNAASIATKIAKDLGLSGRMVEFTHVELRNKLNESRFRQVPYSQRMLFLPHCLRSSTKCKSNYSDDGLDFKGCSQCNSCQLPKIKKLAEDLGYLRVACVPGGSMLEKLVLKYKPKAVVGVACNAEVHLGMDKLSMAGIPNQAVLLLKDGCKDTEANIPEIKEKLELIDPELLEAIKEFKARKA